MFSKQIRRNAARNRKDNGLFFGSLVIAIITFYTLLSLEQQDVMRFLNQMESDAVQKLMKLIPGVYVVSLFFVFFLVYFACKYQTDNRRKEFGMYLMLGMKRSRLFTMLFAETLWSSLFSLVIGIPAALLLTEGISLATAKLIGLGIIGHKFAFSPEAVIYTICGFVFVQLMSMLLICINLGTKEPAELLRAQSAEQQTVISRGKGAVSLAAGSVLLVVAYGLGICFLKYLSIIILGIVAAGIVGTFLFFKGLGCFLGRRARRNREGLAAFTGRQIQENVLCHHKALAISSLLLLMSLSCLSFGIGTVSSAGNSSDRSADLSVFGTEEEVRMAVGRDENQGLIGTYYPVWLSTTDAGTDMEGLANTFDHLKPSPLTPNIQENIRSRSPELIALSSYNQLMETMGKPAVHLEDGEVALYSSMFQSGEFFSTIEDALKYNASMKINGKEYTFLPDLYHDNIVADRAVTLYVAVIVQDQLFLELAEETEPFCYNISITDQAAEELGLMQAIEKVDNSLAGSGLQYESYLKGIGRNLFYTVAGSYLTIYLGILFLLIANTVIGLKYLIQQRQNKHRYVTLLMLGADREAMCKSARIQIQMFFTLVLGVAAFSSVFAVMSMFTGLTVLEDAAEAVLAVKLATAASVIFILAEIIYISIVKRTACREIRMLKVTERG